MPWSDCGRSRGFILDLASDYTSTGGRFRAESIPLLRPQSDQGTQPSEGSVNPDDLWRRSASTWHLGAGQRNFDAPTSVLERFYTSKGIDPWTIGQLGLLRDTERKKVSTATNLRMAVAGGYLYLTEGAQIRYTTDITPAVPTWTDITGEPATGATAITSDGFTVYTAHGADGIYTTTRGAAATASYATGTVAGCEYVKGRLFAWSTDKLYNVTAAGALPAALLDHANSDFAWTAVAEASGFYFAAGTSGDKSLIYRTAVKADGTGLDTPTIAAELPDGETVLALQGYLGFLLIGTTLGVRFGSPDGNGNLTLGGLITAATNVRCFEGQGSYVWFGWNRYDSTSTGLGRMDLSFFNGSRPAYASDLMGASGVGDVQSVVTFAGTTVFTSSAEGVWAPTTSLVASGVLSWGRITYGLFDAKVSMYVTASHEPLPTGAGVQMALSADGGTFVGLSGSTVPAGAVSTSLSTGRARGEGFDVQITLGRGTDTTVGPAVTRTTFRGYPVAARSERITVPLLLNKEQYVRTGSATTRNVSDDLAFLADLEDTGATFVYQVGNDAFEVMLEDHSWVPHQIQSDDHTFSGTYYAKLKRFASE